jgi:hypothetical protein
MKAKGKIFGRIAQKKQEFRWERENVEKWIYFL